VRIGGPKKGEVKSSTNSKQVKYQLRVEKEGLLYACFPRNSCVIIVGGEGEVQRSFSNFILIGQGRKRH